MKSSRKKKTAVARRAKSAAAPKAAVRKAGNSAPAQVAGPAAARIDTTEPGMAATTEVLPETAPPAPIASTLAAGAPQRAGLKLESSFTLRDATDMLFQLLAVDFGDADVLVDGGSVERIDTAGLQMLIAFARHHAARGKTIRWSAVSPELLRSSQLLGVIEPLHLAAHLNQGAAGGH